MPNKAAPESGASRAAEVMDAMKNMPGYADDSLFFIARYSDKAKTQLRDEEWKQLMTLTGELNRLRTSGGDQTKGSEIRQQALDIIKEFPDLVSDYDRFTTCTRTAAAAVWAPKNTSK